MRDAVREITEQTKCEHCETPMRLISILPVDRSRDKLNLRCEQCGAETSLVGTRRHRELIDVPS